MKKLFNYKHTLKCFFVLLVMLSAYSSNASHLSGGDISYKCIGFRKWEITLVLYRDCSGIPMCFGSNGSQTSCTQTLTAKPMATIANGGLNPNGCNNPAPNINLTVTSFKIVSIMQEAVGRCGSSAKNICTNNGTTASGSYMPGIEAYHYKGVLDMSNPIYAGVNVCPYWEVSFEQNSRNPGIINLSNPSGATFYISAIINIHHNQSPVSFANSSPEFKNEAVMVICSSIPIYLNYGTTDPDGDSITYRIKKAKGTGGAELPYVSPLSETRILHFNGGAEPHTSYPQPNGPYVILDSVTGDLSFNGLNSHPTNIYSGVLNLEITQWGRNSSGAPFIVGITQRDLQLYLKNCGANVAPKFATNPTLQNGNPKYNWSLCAGEQLCFTVTAKDDDDGSGPHPSTKLDTTQVHWDKGIERPGKLTFAPDYDTTNPAMRPREDRWRFCWQTEKTDGRAIPYYFTVTGLDNNCPNIGRVVKAFGITVLPVPLLADSLYNDSCGKFRYEVRKLNSTHNYSSARLDIAKEPNDFTFASGSHVTISNNLASPIILADTVSLKKPGKYLVKYHAVATSSCPALTVYDTITVAVGYPQLTLTAQQDTVCKNVATFTLTGAPLRGVYSGTGIDSNGVVNIQHTAILPNNFYVYQYKYVDSVTACADSINKTVFIMLGSSVAITAQDTICKNAALLKLTGNPTGGVFSGTATDNGGTVNIQHPDIVVNSSYEFKYKYNNIYGCQDSTTKIVFVKPSVQTTLSATLDTVCKNVTGFKLTGSPANGVFSGTSINSSTGIINLQSFSINPNTTYTYKYKFSANFGCVDSSLKTIHVLPNITAVLSIPNDTVCQNATVFTLTGTPANGLFYGNGIRNDGVINLRSSAIIPNAFQPYTYTASNSYGCVNSNTKNIFISSMPPVTLTAVKDTVCKNDNFYTLSGSPFNGIFSGTSIHAANGEIDLRFPIVQPNQWYQYKYIYANNLGCKDSAFKGVYVLVNPQVSLIVGNANPQKNTSVTYSVDLVNNINYKWQLNNNKGTIQSTNKNTATILWNDTGSTTISASNYNSCGLVDNTKPILISTSSGLNENSWLDAFTLFPNPATNQITVSFYAKQTDMNLQVFNSTLQLVKTVPLSSVNNQYNTTVSLDNLSAGLYFVKVGNSQYQHTTKVIVNK